MKKFAMMLGACTLLVWGAANAADGQAAAKAKSACQANPTQCSQAKAQAQKEAKAAKDACAKNQSACDNAKAKAKSAVKQ
ncbi:late histone H1 [Citrobacter amalonaticus]|uniref:late histone H1 n=1 Tax=Citrobacter amalonaticus TaxID=35703 RepID=UPI00300D23D6